MSLLEKVLVQRKGSEDAVDLPKPAVATPIKPADAAKPAPAAAPAAKTAPAATAPKKPVSK
jgi:hypothetical protein